MSQQNNNHYLKNSVTSSEMNEQSSRTSSKTRQKSKDDKQLIKHLKQEILRLNSMIGKQQISISYKEFVDTRNTQISNLEQILNRLISEGQINDVNLKEVLQVILDQDEALENMQKEYQKNVKSINEMTEFNKNLAERAEFEQLEAQEDNKVKQDVLRQEITRLNNLIVDIKKDQGDKKQNIFNQIEAQKQEIQKLKQDLENNENDNIKLNIQNKQLLKNNENLSLKIKDQEMEMQAQKYMSITKSKKYETQDDFYYSKSEYEEKLDTVQSKQLQTYKNDSTQVQQFTINQTQQEEIDKLKQQIVQLQQMTQKNDNNTIPEETYNSLKDLLNLKIKENLKLQDEVHEKLIKINYQKDLVDTLNQKIDILQNNLKQYQNSPMRQQQEDNSLLKNGLNESPQRGSHQNRNENSHEYLNMRQQQYTPLTEKKRQMLENQHIKIKVLQEENDQLKSELEQITDKTKKEQQDLIEQHNTYLSQRLNYVREETEQRFRKYYEKKLGEYKQQAQKQIQEQEEMQKKAQKFFDNKIQQSLSSSQKKQEILNLDMLNMIKKNSNKTDQQRQNFEVLSQDLIKHIELLKSQENNGEREKYRETIQTIKLLEKLLIENQKLDDKNQNDDQNYQDNSADTSAQFQSFEPTTKQQKYNNYQSQTFSIV